MSLRGVAPRPPLQFQGGCLETDARSQIALLFIQRQEGQIAGDRAEVAGAGQVPEGVFRERAGPAGSLRSMGGRRFYELEESQGAFSPRMSSARKPEGPETEGESMS